MVLDVEDLVAGQAAPIGWLWAAITGRQDIVGVKVRLGYQMVGDDPEPASFQVDPALASGQIARLEGVRAFNEKRKPRFRGR